MTEPQCICRVLRTKLEYLTQHTEHRQMDGFPQLVGGADLRGTRGIFDVDVGLEGQIGNIDLGSWNYVSQ